MVETVGVTIEPGEIESKTIDAADQAPLDWRFKGMPDAGVSIAEFAARGPDLFTGGFHPPVLTLDDAAIQHNIETLHGWASAHGIALAPHGKTTMAPRLFERQLRAGAWAITAANFSQLRVCRAFGVSRILLANQLVDAGALRWIAEQSRADPRFECWCFVDSVDVVDRMTEALLDTDFRFPVLVELGDQHGRTGARGQQAAMHVARAAAASPRLRLAGVAGYEAALAHDTDAASLSAVDQFLRGLRSLLLTCAGEALLEGQVLVSAGGSAYFDQVGQVLTEPWPTGLDVLPVLRSGAYLTHDSGFYERISPLGEHPRMSSTERLRPAMRLWAQVSSMPEPGLALLTAGRRDVSFDQGMPTPEVLRSGGAMVPLTGARITKLNDQHAFCSVPLDSGVRVGDWIGLGASHPCTVFDKWQLIPLVGKDGATVTGFVRTFF